LKLITDLLFSHITSKLKFEQSSPNDWLNIIPQGGYGGHG
jgi:hypothetical protein